MKIYSDDRPSMAIYRMKIALIHKNEWVAGLGIEVKFASGSGLAKIKSLTVEALPGGRGYSGPVGFYLQAGGDPSKLPAT